MEFEEPVRYVEKIFTDIIKHGQGKMTINIGPCSTDKTSILVEAGKTNKFIIDRFDKIKS